ncbi:MAG: MBL fold metallo-hydrolase, partial [Clostridiales bacterium]|nr:MBL fold metallo-hydrolase [Clostridiales bacterium]
MTEKDLENVRINTQSSIRIEGERIVYFDPFGIDKAAHDADLIFITHDHYDHFSPEDIEKVKNENTQIVFPEGLKKDMKKSGIAPEKWHAVKPGGKYEICGLAVETVAAYNKAKPFHEKRSGWVGYVVAMDGTRYYAMGDSDATREAEGVSCDVLFIPIGGTYTMDVREAAGLANKIRPQVAVPIHYGSIVGKKSDADEF